MKKSSKEDVRAFLADVRTAIRSNNVGFIKTRKNTETLAFFGWTEDDVYDYISELSYGDYFKGPEPDRDYPNDAPFWFFSFSYYSRDIYIKIKVRKEEGKDPRLIIQSFHKDDD